MQDSNANVVIILTLLKLSAFLLSILLTHLTYRSYHNSNQTDIKFLFYGFGMMAVGILFGGGLFWLSNFDIFIGILVESVFLTVSLVAILYSLYGFE